MAKDRIALALSFILAATSDDETRYFMCKPYFDHAEKRLVATDGRRMHYWNLSASDLDVLGLEGVESSTYVEIDPKSHTVAVNSKLTKEATFPNYVKVIPEYLGKGEGIELDLSGKAVDCRETGIPLFCVRNRMALNFRYMADCLGLKWTAFPSPAEPSSKALAMMESSALGEDGIDRAKSHLVAVIMPMAID
jgi:hypothetical protein